MTAATSTASVRHRIRQAADRLLQASATSTPCAPVRDLLADDSVATGYAVQRLLTDARRSTGARIVGRKIGLTSRAVQAQLGVDQPDTGVLFEDMAVPLGQLVDSGRLLQPKIEAEVAFLLAADLPDPGTDASAARAAVESVVPALEIVDSRIDRWDISLVDTVADNASCGLFVLGEARVTLSDQDLRTARMSMSDASGRVVSQGTGADCLGDPLEALAWLARTAADLGDPLRAGEIVLSGALGPMVPVLPGDSFSADITGLGHVFVSFSPTSADSRGST